MTVDRLGQAADEAIAEDPHQAIRLYTAAEAHALPLQRADILEKRAAVKVSLSDQEGALEDYRKASEAVPDSEPERKAGLYMYMGQLMEGTDALALFQQAVDYLQSISNPPIAVKQQLSMAYCTLAELYLTDLCFEPDAEKLCANWVTRALAVTDNEGEPWIDALQTATSLRLSQSQVVEATDYMLQAYRRMQPGCEALARLVGLRQQGMEDPQAPEAAELLETEEVKRLPGFEFRCQSAKLLLECAGSTENSQRPEVARDCAQAAVDVLGSLLAENDEVIEIWMLTGDAFVSLKGLDEAKYHWERAMEMLEAVKTSLESQINQAVDDEEEEDLLTELEEVAGQKEAIEKKISETESSS